MRKYTSPITLLLFAVIVALLQTTAVFSFSSPASVSLQSKHIICPSSSSFHTQQQQCINININKRTNSSSSRLYMSDGVGESAAAAVSEKKGILQKVRHTSIELLFVSIAILLQCISSHLHILQFCCIFSSNRKSHQHPNVKS